MTDRPLLGGRRRTGTPLSYRSFSNPPPLPSSSSRDLEGQKASTTAVAAATAASSSPPPPSPSPSLSLSSTLRKKLRDCKPGPRTIGDAILGLSDGLTVPFALSAGLSGLGDTRVVILGGLAELMAGAISMGLGGYLSAKCDEEAYWAEHRQTQDLIKSSPDEMSDAVREVFKPYGVPESMVTAVNESLSKSPEDLCRFIMSFDKQVSVPETERPYVSASALGLGYFVGGFIPLVPYLCVRRSSDVLVAFYWSSVVMAITLLVFGYLKTGFMRGWKGKENVIAGVKGAVQMLLVGAVAAAAAIFLVRAIDRDV